MCLFNRKKPKLKILTFILITFLILFIVFASKKPDLKRSPRIEDMTLFNLDTSVLTTAFTHNYKLSVVEYNPPDMVGKMAWEPSAYQLVLTDVASGEEKTIERFDAWFIFVLSDGDTFYLFVDKHEDATESNEPYIHQIYSFSPKTETLEHLITYGPTNQDDSVGAFPHDIVANGNQFYFINPHSIQVFDTETKTCEVLYTTEETLVNSYIDNRAKLYQNELFVATDRNELFSIDVLTGKETGRSISFAGTETKLDKYAVPDNFNNFLLGLG